MFTKSDIQSFLQCERKLWLEHHRKDQVQLEQSSRDRRVIDGSIVGEKAKEMIGKPCLFPGGEANQSKAANQAIELLRQSPGVPAVEVPMVNGNLYSRADALIPSGNGYSLRETKASTFPLKADKVTPANPKAHHVVDVAVQAWTMAGSGLQPDRLELNLLDNRWRYPGGGDYRGLFRRLDVTTEATELFAQVPTWLGKVETIVAGEMPTVVTGKQCSDPYDCPFVGICQPLDPPGPDHPIELLPDAAGKSLARKLREEHGYESILEPKPEELTGKNADLYKRIQLAHRTGKQVLEAGSELPLKDLPYPRYYFDFEGIDLPVPRWKGVRPYEQVPFQWSCHVETESGVFEHAEFLDLSGNDPSIPCIQRMRDAIEPGGNGPIFVYYATYERGRLEELALRHPEYADLLTSYIDRLVDLHPLVKSYFYDPRMEGSFSIKKVLPVVAPELDYSQLEEVQEGTGAQIAYLYAAFEPGLDSNRKAELEAGLLKYCRQDTWAMVEVAYFLSKVGRPTRPAE